MQQAAACLDAALAQRSSNDSYLLVTLHLYKHSSSGGPVGRSRLHLLDLCGGGSSSVGCDQKGSRSDSAGMAPSSIGNILLAILNGQKHLPYRDQVLTQTLKECLGSLRCQAAMIAHVSQSSAHHLDSIATIQLASRIHRLRRRRFKMIHNIISANEETEHRLPESVDPSSSEQSADTVIYLGPGDTETDGEHPPVYLHGLLAPSTSTPNSPQRSISKNSSRSAKSSPGRTKTKPLLNGGEEKWVDGPKIPKSKLVEARNIVLHKDRSGQKETWVDGPNGYGYSMMDYSKRNMIRRWVENQSVQVQAQNRRKEKLRYRELTTFKKCNADSMEQRGAASGREDSAEDEGPPVTVTATETLPNEKNTDISRVVPIQRLQALGEESKSQELQNNEDVQEEEVQTELEMKEEDRESKESSECGENLDDDYINDDEDDDDEEIIVVEEPTELVPMQDCCLQVTEEDIALCMGEVENPLPEVDQEGQEHPLRILSQENLTIMSSLTGLVDDRWQTELGQNDEDNASIVSEPLYYSNKSNEEVYCHNCKLSMATASTKRHYHLNSLNRLSKSISLLRHPDGSSNPNLSGLGLDDGWKQKDKQDPLQLLNDQDDAEGLNVTVPPLPPLHSTVMNLSASSGFQYSSVQSRNTFLRQMNNHSRNIHDPGGRGDWYCKRLQQLRQLRSEIAAHQRLQRLTTNPASWMCKFSMHESWLQRDHMS